jgi:hypothetical protein
MLNAVLKAVQQSQGPLRIQELSRELNIDPGALEGMLEFWIRKGRIQRERGTYAGCEQSACCPVSCKSCSRIK